LRCKRTKEEEEQVERTTDVARVKEESEREAKALLVG
jgi:hypothetical protein